MTTAWSYWDKLIKIADTSLKVFPKIFPYWKLLHFLSCIVRNLYSWSDNFQPASGNNDLWPKPIISRNQIKEIELRKMRQSYLTTYFCWKVQPETYFVIVENWSCHETYYSELWCSACGSEFESNLTQLQTNSNRRKSSDYETITPFFLKKQRQKSVYESVTVFLKIAIDFNPITI